MSTDTRKTSQEFDQVIARAKKLFENKLHDYGAAWRILRPESLTDQIFIKAKRVCNIQAVGKQRVEDNIKDEFIGIINYGIIGRIQLELGVAEAPVMDIQEALSLYERKMEETKALMLNKNHDYGEAWRQMRISSISDLILSKVYRTKQIEDLDGQTRVSEGIDANYMDMINYAIFALILLDEMNHQPEQLA